MHKALVLIYSRALIAATRDPASREQVLRRLLEAPQLLPWYTEGVVTSFRGEMVSAAQVGAALLWVQHCEGGALPWWCLPNEPSFSVVAQLVAIRQGAWGYILPTATTKSMRPKDKVAPQSCVQARLACISTTNHPSVCACHVGGQEDLPRPLVRPAQTLI